MKIVYKLDLDGFYLDEIVIEDNAQIPANCVTNKPQDGLFKPRYVNGQWVEFLSQEEIDAKLNTNPAQLTDIEILKQENEQLKKRVEEAENAIMTLMDMSLL